MKPVFEIDGKDFSWVLAEGGLKWSRNDLDSEKSGRSLSGAMQRSRIGIKRKLSVSCMRMPTVKLMELNAALLPTFVKVKYLDAIDGVCTKTFYGSTVEATTQIYMDGETYWAGTTFNLIER